MFDAARRVLPIVPTFEKYGPALSFSLDSPRARYALRMRSDGAAKLKRAGGVCLDTPINTCKRDGDCLTARLGPDEWLIWAPDHRAQWIADAFEEAGSSLHFSMVDISHRNVSLSIQGAQVIDVLNGGCPLDLSEAAFPAGYATRTVLGKAEIVLLRPHVDGVYHLECGRSFAPYIHDLLKEIAREFIAL